IGADPAPPAQAAPAPSPQPHPPQASAPPPPPPPAASAPEASAEADPGALVPAAPASSAPPPPQGMAPELAAHLTLPNILTGLRVVLVFLIVILLLWPWGPFLTGALILFGIAAATDWLDGRLARAWNQTSELGRMLDHIADKLLVGVTMLTLCAVGVIDGLNALAAALILARELAVSGLREHLSAKGMVLPSSIFAKWKTTFQMVAIAALMAAPLAPISSVARFTGLVILWVAMVMTLISGAQYVWASRDAWKKT
ncbi:MAG: CDP-diacylglycerol--glycerol-3-phosphate 3-phosphatidyltransferase, partial [Pseudomonadota bacterium]